MEEGGDKEDKEEVVKVADATEEFLERLGTPLEDYLSQYMPYIEAKRYSEQYIESWTFISEGVKSLQFQLMSH
ncbi:hypothetical protein MLOOGBEN_04675 [Bacillus sp. EB106-08-02-XG196]|nr:hypothetical protein [Bacillus sp. EB106-08-02-XG196]